MNERRMLNAEEADQLHVDLLARAMPIRFAGPRSVDMGGLNVEVPFVQLDAGARPDVDDLFRVVAAEGHQPDMRSIFRYLLRGGRGYMEISIRLADPVECAFTFVLEWPMHASLFELLLMQEQLLFTTQALDKEHIAPVLGVKIARAELQPILNMWRDAARSSGTRP